MFCIKCGTKLIDGATFCANCGTPTSKTAEATISTQMPEIAESAKAETPAIAPAKVKKPKKTREKKLRKPLSSLLFRKHKKRNDAEAITDAAPSAADAPKEKNPWKRLNERTKKIVLICGGAFILICAALTIVLVELDKAERYEAAFALMEDEEYAQALVGFEELRRYKDSEVYAPQCQYSSAEDMMADGKYNKAKQEFLDLADYEDAAARAQECQNTMDYLDAEQQLEDGSFEDAKQAFIALGDFTDAHARSQECQDNIDYLDAIAMMEALQNEDALAIFTRLGYFKNSLVNAQECQNRIDYDKAIEMMAAGDYKGALKIFTALQSFSDSYTLAAECRHIIDYTDAEQALTDGKNYTAYVIFDNLGSYTDAKQRAQECILETPESKELYRNADYSSTRCSITFHAAKGGDVDYNTLVKIYSEEGDLVSIVFLRPNEKLKIRIPSGSYTMKKAVGVDWFGQEEMFGDYAIYEVLQFEDGELTNIRSSYYYTIKFDVEDGNISGREEDREDF